MLWLHVVQVTQLTISKFLDKCFYRNTCMMEGFLTDRNSCGIHTHLTVLPLEIQFSTEEDWDPINQFIHTTFLHLSQTRTWISNILFYGFSIFNDLSLLQGVCLFCWYWWDCWPPLSFHNKCITKHSQCNWIYI
jgi:hypothetical protein